MSLREQHEATGVMTETGVKYFKYTYTQWLEARDEKHLAEIEGLEKEIKPLRLMKQNDDDIISGYENAHINMEHELSTLKQFIEDAPVIEIEWDEDGNLFESKSGGFIEYEGFVKGGKPHIPIKVRLVEVEK